MEISGQPIDEGYIKFKLKWEEASPMDFVGLSGMLAMRNHLYDLGLIGVYPVINIGYGNISVRDGSSRQFYISGTRTGAIPVLTGEEVTRVEEYDIAANSVVCHGPVEASSESLTHAAIYECDPGIGAVIHVHHLEFWRALLGQVPSSKADVPYGTPEMAAEVARLYAETNLPEVRLMAMGGHEEGIISFGEDLNAAWEVLQRHFERWKG